MLQIRELTEAEREAYDEMAIFRYGAEVKSEQNIPGREWTDDGKIINQEVNLAAEEIHEKSALYDYVLYRDRSIRQKAIPIILHISLRCRVSVDQISLSIDSPVI